MRNCGFVLYKKEIMWHIHYNERIALGIVMRAKESFYDMFCELKKEIDKNWL